MKIEPYLFFEGRCAEALEFYKAKLGATVTTCMKFSESPEPHQPGALPPGSEDKIMHANLRIGDAVFMASDGNCSGKPSFHGISLTLNVADEAEADRVFAALSDGGQVQMPLAKTFYSPRFGMVTDRFGVPWMVIADRK